MSYHQGKNYNNTNTEVISVCRSFYGNELKARGYKIHGLYQCRFGATCKEAHKWEQIRMKKHIREWYSTTDKSTIDLLALEQNIISVINQSKDSIKNSKFSGVVHMINRMAFVELLQFCYDLICYHRKIAKELPSKRSQGSEVPGIGEGGYRYKEEVPQFYLENEDLFWALERSLHTCKSHMTMMSNKDMSFQATAICCGDINCKFGEHDITKVACVEDIISGSCTCLTSQQIMDETKRIESELLVYKKQIEESLDAEGFQIKISKKIRDEISQKIIALQRAYSSIPIRKIHYTEQGMIPLAKRKETIKAETKEVDISKLEITTPVAKIVKKSYGKGVAAV
jgi:hypothetical protein